MTTRISWLVALGIGTFSQAALAQPTQDDKAAAEALYEAGKTLLRTDVAAACEKFAASQELDPGVGTLLYLGACYERLGRVASAWAAFREAASYAHRSSQADREKTANERAARIEPRVPKLIIDAGTGAAPGLEVRRDQKVVPGAMLGVPIPLDPGKHTVVADAPGKATWSSTIELGEGESKTVHIPALGSDGAAEPGPVAAPPVDAAPASLPKSAVSAPPPAPMAEAEHGSRFTSTQGRIGIAVGAIGIATMAVGGYFGVRAMSKWGEAKDHCVDLACDQSGVSLHDEAQLSGNVSTALMAIGAVAVGTGLVLVMKAPAGKSEARIGAIATPELAMLSVGGAL